MYSTQSSFTRAPPQSSLLSHFPVWPAQADVPTRGAAPSKYCTDLPHPACKGYQFTSCKLQTHSFWLLCENSAGPFKCFSFAGWHYSFASRGHWRDTEGRKRVLLLPGSDVFTEQAPTAREASQYLSSLCRSSSNSRIMYFKKQSIQWWTARMDANHFWTWAQFCLCLPSLLDLSGNFLALKQPWTTTFFPMIPSPIFENKYFTSLPSFHQMKNIQPLQSSLIYAPKIKIIFWMNPSSPACQCPF